MSYINSAEFYAAMVANGQMTMEQAAQQLSDETNGGLTPRGAADVISDPRKAAVKLGYVFDDARVGLERIKRELGES